LVTLGNNHCFDGKDEGFLKLTSLLNDIEIPYFGAGLNHDEASKAATFEINGITVAFIAAVDASSGMYRFATGKSSGVNKLDQIALCDQIATLKKQYDHVIITPHWGEERFRQPSPLQCEQAHAFTQAGASIVIGHHPHVMQGLEWHESSPIIYSLGNFLANNVYWDNADFLTWNRFERTGCMIRCELDAHGAQKVQQIPVYDDGTTISIEKNGWGNRYINKANKMLTNGITKKRYQRETFRVRTILPIINHLRWDKLKHVRLEHVRKAIKLLATGSSTK